MSGENCIWVQVSGKETKVKIKQLKVLVAIEQLDTLMIHSNMKDTLKELYLYI